MCFPLPDNWYRRNPVLTYAINHQIEEAQAGVGAFGLEGAFWSRCTPTNLEKSPARWFFSSSESGAERLRKRVGGAALGICLPGLSRMEGGKLRSCQCSFTQSRGTNGIPGCWFPIRRGRRPQRFFRAVRTLGRYIVNGRRVWLIRATTNCFLHAFESGLRVMGDTRYAHFPVPGLADFKRDYRPSRRFEEDPPLFDSPLVRLASLRLTDGQGGEDIIPIAASPGSGTAPSACWRSLAGSPR